MNKEAAFQAWAESFGIPAYAATAVPDDATEPYLTYALATGMWGDGEQACDLSVWYRTTSEAKPNAKAREIGEALGIGGTCLPCDEGLVWVKRGQPFSQPVDSGDNAVKRRYINLSVEFLTTY